MAEANGTAIASLSSPDGNATGATGNSTSPSANPYFFDGKAAYPCAECCY